ncbi:hypothetical protein [Thalassotalea litorea]|uniref:hypothetical protein n=1 Tax=Thalassotalea litorea TaxID=2020715 RepID=UPI0037353389
MANLFYTLCGAVIASLLFAGNVMAQQEQAQSLEVETPEQSRENAEQEATATNSSVTTAPTSSGFITLETTIVGNKEQPKVLSIVPWQNPEQAGSLSTEITTQIEQVFRPLDSESLQREIVYFKQSQQ